MFTTVDVSDGDVDTSGLRFVTVHSPALRRRADVSVWTPPGADGPLPLVTLLHGVYGSHWGWAFKGRAHQTAARLIDGGVVRPIALAMPSDGLFGLGSGYIRHEDADYEAWIVDEVPAAAAAADPRIDATLPGALVGLSMGGYGALRLAARHPERYGAAAGMSSITQWETMSVFVGDLSAYPRPADPDLGPVLTNAADRLAIRFDCGLEDLLLQENRALHDELTAAGIDHTYLEHLGGHDWEYWATHLGDSLRFVAAHLEMS